MRTGAHRLVATLALLTPIAIACAPFAGDDPKATTTDASTMPKKTPDSSVTTVPSDASVVPTNGVDSSVDASTCPSISDDFGRATVVGGIWSTEVADPNTDLKIAVDLDDGSFLQSSTTAGPAGAKGKSGYLVTTLPSVPSTLTCTFKFRPDTDFQTGNGTLGDGPGLDIVQMVFVHADGTSVRFRFSYKSGKIEVRDDHLKANGDCLGQNMCPVQDLSNVAGAEEVRAWSTMTVSTDFKTTTISDGVAAVSAEFADPGQVQSVQLFLGLANFGMPEQTGSFDDFHCDLGC